MTKYLRMNLRSLLTNPYILFWSILFIEFWVFMWAYIFGNQIPQIEEAMRTYSATAYGNLLMLSLSGAAVTIASSLLYSSKSIRYVTKYTRLSPSRFLLENLFSSITALLVISGVMFISVIGAFLAKFGFIILPVDPLGLLFGVFLSTLFIYVLSMFLNLVLIIARASKSSAFISFLPLILAFTAYASLWIDFGYVTYISPFNCIISICYYFLSGQSPPTGNFFTPSEKMLVNVGYAGISLTLWWAFLMLIDIFLLKKIRGISVEEIRTT